MYLYYKSALNFIKKTAFVFRLWSEYNKTFPVEKKVRSTKARPFLVYVKIGRQGARVELRLVMSVVQLKSPITIGYFTTQTKILHLKLPNSPSIV